MAKQNSIFKTELFEIQKPIAKAIKKEEVAIITAPPGCGKDFIQMQVALSYLLDKTYGSIVITKPIVEVGRSMGFMPGNEKEKLSPYRKSFDDIVTTLIGNEDSGRINSLKNKIIFQPLNFIRGNTFKNSIVILSEAQNCTLHELISFITRLDHTSKMFINGDLGQSDLGNKSGLRALLTIVKDIQGICQITLGDEFQTRNPLIVELNKKYNEYRALS